ncbi:MAG TPA: tetratricopeptide repeat protein [Candidatus Acidoferrum sp.]|nr:tetratricopeptide repeat protein [Candidatus Acidoferrum sp.]
MDKRIEAAQKARGSADPLAAAQANKLVISMALRLVCRLCMVEGAYPQAIEICRRSLDFEESTDTRLDLAMSESGANRTDEAIADANRILASDPNNVRALTIYGRAFMSKQEYAKAADALSRAVQIAPDIETYYSLGISLLSTKNPADKEHAATVFQQMIQLAGDNGSLHVLFGRAYRDADDMPSAIHEFERAIALDTKTPHAHYFLALAHLAVNEWKSTPESKAEFAKELQYHPRDYLANYLMGFLASSERQYAEADRYLRIAAEIGPEWPEPWLYLGLDAYAQGDMKSAEEFLRKSVKLTGDDESRSNYQIRRAYVDLGRILANSGRTEESEVFLTKARELQKKTMELTQQNIAAKIAEGGGTMAAVVAIKPDKDVEAAALLPAGSDPFARIDASLLARSRLTKEQRGAVDAEETRLRAILGLSFNDLATAEAVSGQFLAALGHYQDAERWDASIPGLAKNLGLSAYRADNFPEAIRGLSKALQENSSDAPVRALLGMSYFGSDKFAEAVKTFSPLATAGMKDPTVGYAWAASLAHLGDLKPAGEILGVYEQGKLTPEALLMVGRLWIEIGDYGRSIAALHRALQADSSLPKAHYFAGQANILWEHWGDAAAEFTAELAVVPSDPDAKFNLGFVYLQQSKVDDAAELFRQVLVLHPEHAKSQYELGKILLDRGEVKEAIEHLEAAARLSPETDYVHYQLQAAYRKESRIADADRELELYKELKAKSRERTVPQPVQRP